MEFTSRRRTSSFFVALAVFIVGFSFWSERAFAEHKETIDVRFETLKVHQTDDGVKVRYVINKKDWRRLKKVGIQPKLKLYRYSSYGGADFISSGPMNHRDGHYLFRDVRLRTKQAQVRLSGHRHGTRIGDLGFGSQCAKRLTVDVIKKRKKKKKHQRPSLWSNHEYRQILDVCSRFGIGKNNCFELAQKHGEYAPNALSACGDATKWRSEFTSCVNVAIPSRGKQVGKVIAACDQATQWSSELNSCLKRAGRLDGGRAKAVSACDKTTKWASELNACLDNAKGLGRQAGRIIFACEDATKWDSEFNTCLKLSKNLSGKRDAAIRACGDATKWNSEFNACLKKVKGHRKPGKVVAACDRQTQWNSEFSACLKESKRHGEYADEWVDYCGERTQWNSEFKSCLAGRNFAQR